jgi:hypothetical protein
LTFLYPVDLTWFSPGTPASSTTKTGRHDMAEILLKASYKKQQYKATILFQKERKKSIALNFPLFCNLQSRA